jgi:hypothetical protein
MPQRIQLVGELVGELVQHHKWCKPIVVSEHSHIHEDTARLIRAVVEEAPGAPWVLYLEDDVELGPRFDEIPALLGEVDRRFPTAGVVSFFSVLDVDYGFSERPVGAFAWAQCTALRSPDPDAFEGFSKFFYGRPGMEGIFEADKQIGGYYLHRGLTWLLYTPSLVQHRPVESCHYIEIKDYEARKSPTFEREFRG